jgi:hypothetical protein
MGFRKRKSFIDAIFILKHVIDKRIEYDNETLMVFVDLKKSI